MKTAPSLQQLQPLWDSHHQAWRHPAQAVSAWSEAGKVDPNLLAYQTRGPWWDLLQGLKIQILLTREYEHFLLMLRPGSARGRVSYFMLPHPSGLAVTAQQDSFYVASTRNPNAVYEFAPVSTTMPRRDMSPDSMSEPSWLPRRTAYFPGCLYLHDLAMVGGQLHANAVGHNAVVKLDIEKAAFQRKWWPRCMEQDGAPHFTSNHLQLNSIAAGRTLRDSFFSASASAPSRRRPGHKNFPVDGRGVIFSGRTREPYACGLTRPHSARLHQGSLYVNNSGYGGFCRVTPGHVETIRQLPG